MRSTIIILIGSILCLDFLAAYPVSQWNRFHLSPSGASKDVQRYPRSTIGNNYIIEVFLNIHFGYWLIHDCDVLYNCQNVSALYCNGPSLHFSSDGPLPKPCSLNFFLGVENDSITIGADLALYKAPEPSTSNDIYEIYFLVAKSADDPIPELALTTTVPSYCSGWQMFHLSSSIMSQFTQPGAIVVNFELLVFKNDDWYSLPCDIVHSLFVFNATAHNANNELDTQEPTNSISLNATTQAPKPSNPFGKKEEDLECFTPVLTLFEKTQTNKHWTKREAKTEAEEKLRMNTESKLSHHKSCQILNNWVPVNSTYWINEKEYPVIAPRIYNAGRCGITGGYPNSCLPVEEKPLQLLLENYLDGESRAFKHIAPELKIIVKCV